MFTSGLTKSSLILKLVLLKAPRNHKTRRNNIGDTERLKKEFAKWEEMFVKTLATAKIYHYRAKKIKAQLKEMKDGDTKQPS